ncbi:MULTISPECIES: NAD(P)H-dependent oxidoreductase [unclassified Bradyrhizobium]|uniref:NAD(P)H-dependent oxidoreductase n=1 Tax=unclassified Bradyrhizobium TaxID=2631580 RepID=UPI0028EC4ECB|nr:MULTISPECIES: NAD(P)H-dependent oxidoreductase [unclassified Bradyrhizobium]
MSSFVVMSLSASEVSCSRQCGPIIVSRLRERKCEVIEVDIRSLPAVWADNRQLDRYPSEYERLRVQISTSDGIVILLPIYCFGPSGSAKAVVEITSAAFAGKPVAFVVGQGSPRSHLAVRDLMTSLTFDAHAICFPRTVDVLPDDVSSDGEIKSEAGLRLEQMIGEFVVFAATAKLFREVVSDVSGGNDLHTPRVNHLNIMTRHLPNAIKFYSETLGARHLYNLGPRKAVTDLAGFEFFIEEVEQVLYPPSFHFGVRTTAQGVRELEARLALLGVKFVKGNGPAPGAHAGEDGVRWALYFEDPDGLMIEVYSPELAAIEHGRSFAASQLRSA